MNGTLVWYYTVFWKTSAVQGHKHWQISNTPDQVNLVVLLPSVHVWEMSPSIQKLPVVRSHRSCWLRSFWSPLAWSYKNSGVAFRVIHITNSTVLLYYISIFPTKIKMVTITMYRSLYDTFHEKVQDWNVPPIGSLSGRIQHEEILLLCLLGLVLQSWPKLCGTLLHQPLLTWKKILPSPLPFAILSIEKGLAKELSNIA